MNDEDLIKTAATAAHYTQHIPTKMLLEMLAHRLEELGKELEEAKAVQTVMYPKAPPAVPLSACEGLQP